MSIPILSICVPFRTWHGMTACIYVIQHWLTRKLGMNQEGHEENLVRALSRDCSLYRRREDFDTIVADIRKVLGVWRGGRYLADVAPEFAEAPASAAATTRFTGTNAKGMLYFPGDTAACGLRASSST